MDSKNFRRKWGIAFAGVATVSLIVLLLSLSGVFEKYEQTVDLGFLSILVFLALVPYFFLTLLFGLIFGSVNIFGACFDCEPTLLGKAAISLIIIALYYFAGQLLGLIVWKIKNRNRAV